MGNVSIEGNAASRRGGPAAKAPSLGVHVQASPFNKLVKLVLPARGCSATGVVQLFQSNGRFCAPKARIAASGHRPTHAVAAGRRSAFFSDATVCGTHVRILDEMRRRRGVAGGAAADRCGQHVTHLKLVLALVCLGGIALAAALGLLVSRTALIPVASLTGAAERVARTQDSATASRRRGG